MQAVWIALFLPDLSLQVAHRGLIRDLPLAISDGPSNHPLVFSANAAALQSGVRREMSVTAARALCAQLLILPRAAEREQVALEQVASTVCCFTPNTSLIQHAVLLEVSTTLKLFGGLAALIKRVRTTLRELGYAVTLGVASTPLAAWLLAKARALAHDVHLHPRLPPSRGMENLPSLLGGEGGSEEVERLANLALTLFDWPRETLTALNNLAIKRICDVLNLPRDGVIKRFGSQIIEDIDKALGRIPDPRLWFTPPEKFFTRIELPAEVAESEMLLFPLRRMLRELQQFLRMRGVATDALTLRFEHGSALQTALQINTSEAARNVARWETLIRERLGKTVFAANVSALSLEVSSWCAYTPPNASWLPDRSAQTSAWHALIDRLVARLGEGQVFSVSVQDDHRPERASALQSMRASALQPMHASALQQTHASAQQSTHALAKAVRGGATRLLAATEKQRPLWLLEQPRALTWQEGRLQYHGDVQFIAGPERIEAGWWDGQPARRDYFIARNAFGELLWIYRDLKRDSWCLHGLFA